MDSNMLIFWIIIVCVVGFIITMIILRSTTPQKIREIGYLIRQFFLAIMTVLFILRIVMKLFPFN